MKVVGIIQARMGSTRLPGKVMRPLNGRSVLAHVVERVRACSALDTVVVATTTGRVDDAIADEAISCGAHAFRGSEDDVLSRYWGAASAHFADVVVRVTSDCPLFDAEVLSRMLQRYIDHVSTGKRLDYLSNALERSYPRGLDAEVLSIEALSVAQREARLPHEREHVTPYIYQHPLRFTIQNYSESWGLQHHRWTLDTEEDWSLISAIYAAFPGRGLFPTSDVLALLQRCPDLATINATVEQKPMPGPSQ